MVKIDEIKRSDRKTLSIVIERSGRVVVHAPKRTSEREIEKFVQEKQGWIEKNRDRILKENSNETNRCFVSGAKFSILGKEYVLRLVDNGTAKFSGDYIYCKTADENKVHQTLVKLFKATAKIVLENRLKEIAQKLNISYNSFKISSAKTRWGSCSYKNEIRLNFRLIFFEFSVIDYVIVHELCHVKEKNHGKKFWEDVSLVFPDYKIKRKILRSKGNLIDF